MPAAVNEYSTKPTHGIRKDDYAKCNQCKIALTESIIDGVESVEFRIRAWNIYYYGINK